MEDPHFAQTHAMLHGLWTKAVGTPDYDKPSWQRLEQRIEEIYGRDTKPKLTTREPTPDERAEVFGEAYRFGAPMTPPPAERPCSLGCDGTGNKPTQAHLRSATKRTPFGGPHCSHCHASSGSPDGHSEYCERVKAKAVQELKDLER